MPHFFNAMNRHQRLLLSLYSLLLCRVTAWTINGFFEGGVKTDVKVATASLTASSSRVYLRMTQEQDLPTIADFLASSVVSTKENNNWKAKIDQLWAKADIESLLSCRHAAIQEGRKAAARLSKLQPLSENDRLRILWQTSDKLRNLVAKASQDTGEDNLWRNHNLAVPPQDIDWLQHLQITAVLDNKVVGFCEVAMLSNPILIQDDQDEELCVPRFSPAITNLAVDPNFRRRGIATKLLNSAERYTKRHWNTESLGLYVQVANDAAMKLYESVGYERTVTCDGGERLGEMWYMSKAIKTQRRQQQNEKEVELIHA